MIQKLIVYLPQIRQKMKTIINKENKERKNIGLTLVRRPSPETGNIIFFIFSFFN